MTGAGKANSAVKTSFIFVLVALLLFPASVLAQQPAFDVLIKNGTVYDGSGGPAKKTDIGISGDRIVAIGNLKKATATTI
ncbi:MAG TPA: hypothetical protein VJT71_01925, partial [Pyrinomonadaceae bacterium]|nr:hypothetical protein [Pyrinomonadaceae bacterium]